MVKILFEDNHLLAAEKPSGLLTQPSEKEKNSLEYILKDYVKTTYKKLGKVFLHAIFRLDKGSSGIVLFAKTSKALSRLQEALRDQKFIKIYRALVSPPPKEPKNTLHHFLKKDLFHTKIASQGKMSSLSYTICKQKNHKALLEITLHTGRYHQIRAQLSAIGSPIIGDKKYGSPFFLRNNTFYLHHHQLSFPHPISQKTVLLFSKEPFSL